jgi:hypothetical protein
MKLLFKIGILSLAVAGVLFAAFHYTRAQGQNPTSMPGAQANPASAKDPSGEAMPYNLIASYFNQVAALSLTGTATGGDYTSVDNLTTIKCPNYKGCMLEAEQSVQLCLATANDNRWSLSLYVDGTRESYNPYGGLVLNSPVNCELANSAQTASLKAGTHTVQTFVYVDDTTELWSYHIAYRVYAPGQALFY